MKIKRDSSELSAAGTAPAVRLYSRSDDWNVRLTAIAVPLKIKAKSFTIDGEAIVLGLTACQGSRSRPVRGVARTAILCGFDLIEHDGEELRDGPCLDRKAALARLRPPISFARWQQRKVEPPDNITVAAQPIAGGQGRGASPGR
jgi:ATP-dependent DNA ligase